MTGRFSSCLKRIAAVSVLAIIACFSLSACMPDTGGLGVYDEKKVVFKQLEPMKDGEETAVIKTKLGDIKIRFFPEEAPNAVENFKQLAKDGYYDGKSIYNIQSVQDDSTNEIHRIAFMSGAEDKDGISGKSVVNNGKPYKKELSYNLYPFPGAVAAYTDKKNCDSRFFVIGEAPITKGVEEGMRVSNFPPTIQKKFKEIGGVPSLTQSYTIFAQVYEGYEIAKELMNVDIDKEGRPVQDIFIESITLEKYSKK